MRFGAFNIKLATPDRSMLAKNSAAQGILQTKPGKVEQYTEVTTKTFGSYKTAAGSTAVTFDIVEGLYKRTLMRKVIDKQAGDATRLGYEITCTDMNGNRHEAAEQVVKDVDRVFRRNTQKWIYRDRNIYGDAFLYKQIGPSATGLSQVQNLYLMSPKNMTPVQSNGQLTGWQYQSQSGGGTVDLKPEEVIHIARDPLTGQLYGDSLFESVLQVLNLILNTQLNSAIILDHFAIPMIHWMIDSKHEKRKTPLSEQQTFSRRLKKLVPGADLITDSSITHEIVGGGSNVFDFSAIMNKLDSYFFATAGIPGSILGMEADNLSAITRQLQTYYDNIIEEQYSVADELIYQLYWPEVINAGIDDVYSINIIPNKPMLEQESRIWTWVKEAMAMDVITIEQGLRFMGIPGSRPTESNGLDWIMKSSQAMGTGNVSNSPQFDKNQQNPKPKGTNPKVSSKSGT